jgi:hypothetical protein
MHVLKANIFLKAALVKIKRGIVKPGITRALSSVFRILMRLEKPKPEKPMN